MSASRVWSIPYQHYARHGVLLSFLEIFSSYQKLFQIVVLYEYNLHPSETILPD